MSLFQKAKKTDEHQEPENLSEIIEKEQAEAKQWGAPEEKREIKKGFELSIVKKTYQYLWVLLPLTIVFMVCLTIYMWVEYFIKYHQKTKLEAANKAYMTNINQENDGLINIISGYNRTLEQYNRHNDTAINFNTLFNTIENYIPKDMDRTNLRIKLEEWWKLKVNLSGKVSSYAAYIWLLSVIDKCNFTDEAEKDRMTQLTRVEFGWDNGNGESLSETKSVSIQFDFDINKNQILRDTFYKKMTKQFGQQANFLYLQSVIDGNKQDVWSETGIDYISAMDNIVAAKQQFSQVLWELAHIDETGYHIKDLWENFITEYSTQNKIFEFLIKYNEEKRRIFQNRMSSVFDGGDVKYTVKDTERNIVNIKEIADKRLLEINTLIAQLTILKRYNEYLLDNNQLETFAKIKSDKWAEADNIIADIIASKNIITESDPLISSLISPGLSTEAEKEEEMKKKYVEMFNFAKESDAMKTDFLNIKPKYIDTFYAQYYNDQLLSVTYHILNTFIGAGFNEEIFENLKYNTFSFNATNANANFSYKKRFYLTLKNDPEMKLNLDFLKDEAAFSSKLTAYDEFKQQEQDIILFNNSKINCLARDVRREMMTVYDDVLKEQNMKLENDKRGAELNIIIETIKESQSSVNQDENNEQN